MVATAIYLPCLIGFFVDCDHCLRVWVHMLPALPGAMPAAFLSRWLGFGRLEDTAMVVTATAISLTLLIALAWLGRRGWRWLVVSLIVGGGLSLVSCLGILERDPLLKAAFFSQFLRK